VLHVQFSCVFDVMYCAQTFDDLIQGFQKHGVVLGAAAASQKTRATTRAFPIFDMLIRSGDIRDQSRKMSKTRKILDDFFAVINFLGRAL